MAALTALNSVTTLAQLQSSVNDHLAAGRSIDVQICNFACSKVLTNTRHFFDKVRYRWYMHLGDVILIRMVRFSQEGRAGLWPH